MRGTAEVGGDGIGFLEAALGAEFTETAGKTLAEDVGWILRAAPGITLGPLSAPFGWSAVFLAAVTFEA